MRNPVKERATREESSGAVARGRERMGPVRRGLIYVSAVADVTCAAGAVRASPASPASSRYREWRRWVNVAVRRGWALHGIFTGAGSKSAQTIH
jgi:hypothetical protein